MCIRDRVSAIGKYAGREQVSGTGSGVIISAEGHIVTNNHVVDGAKSIYVTLNDGTRMKASLIGVDSSSDLAVVKIEKSGLHVAEMGSSASLNVGEMAIAIGNPFGSQLGKDVYKRQCFRRTGSERHQRLPCRQSPPRSCG